MINHGDFTDQRDEAENREVDCPRSVSLSFVSEETVPWFLEARVDFGSVGGVPRGGGGCGWGCGWGRKDSVSHHGGNIEESCKRSSEDLGPEDVLGLCGHPTNLARVSGAKGATDGCGS